MRQASSERPSASRPCVRGWKRRPASLAVRACARSARSRRRHGDWRGVGAARRERIAPRRPAVRSPFSHIAPRPGAPWGSRARARPGVDPSVAGDAPLRRHDERHAAPLTAATGARPAASASCLHPS